MRSFSTRRVRITLSLTSRFRKNCCAAPSTWPRWRPTSANQSPLRVVFLRSKEAKQRLAPALSPGNLDKTLAAPVVAITGYDLKFYEHLPFLFPHVDAKSWFSGNPEFAERSAFQNGTLQVAYFLLALRAVGLDTGPMTGFDNAKVDAEFFAGDRREVERDHQHRLRRLREAVPAQPAFRLRSDRQVRLSATQPSVTGSRRGRRAFAPVESLKTTRRK